MKFSILSIAAMAPFASAHYFFNKLIIEGKETKNDEFVRQNTRPLKFNPTKWENIRDDMTPDVTDFRCNKGAFTSASKTGIAEIKAGAKLSVKLAVGATMQHPGPAIVYMSRAPTTADKYEGDGEWFKIFEEAVCNPSGDFTRDAWCTWDKDTIDFVVPKDLPDGDYLIRPEHIGIHGAHVGQAEFYYSCVQVRVTGGGNGVPGPTVKFPGAYKRDDPSFNFSIYGGIKPYPMPGPPVWGGAPAAKGTTGTTGTPTQGGGSTNPSKVATPKAVQSSAAPAAPKPAQTTPAAPAAPAATTPAAPAAPAVTTPAVGKSKKNKNNCAKKRRARRSQQFREEMQSRKEKM